MFTSKSAMGHHHPHKVLMLGTLLRSESATSPLGLSPKDPCSALVVCISREGVDDKMEISGCLSPTSQNGSLEWKQILPCWSLENVERR